MTKTIVLTGLLATLNVNLNGLDSTKGSLRYLLFNSSEGFPDHAEKSLKQGSVSADHTELKISDIPPGSYAFTIFHDENDNNKLDTNFIGIPKEAFGFSNNPKILFGAPSFEKCEFEVKEDKTITIEMKRI
jgi:uncharacterized protein (DUF2141 family)